MERQLKKNSWDLRNQTEFPRVVCLNFLSNSTWYYFGFGPLVWRFLYHINDFWVCIKKGWIYKPITYINDLNVFSHYLSEVYYRAGLTPKQYQVELERQLRKTTLGISVGLLKSFAPNTKSMFDPYGHFGQTFQQIGESNNNINQYKICEVKPPSIEKVGSRLEL